MAPLIISPTRPDAVTSPTLKRIPGEAGTWVFIGGDLLMFAIYFVYFIVERSNSPAEFDSARRTLHIGIGLTNTMVLLASSLCVLIAVGSIRARAGSIGTVATASALGCGLTFIALKVVEYSALIDAGHAPRANRFYLAYFILTGIHLLHVVLGTVVLVFLMTQTRRAELSTTRMKVVEGGACFWHLVDLLWLMLFSLLYLAS